MGEKNLHRLHCPTGILVHRSALKLCYQKTFYAKPRGDFCFNGCFRVQKVLGFFFNLALYQSERWPI